MIPFQTLFSNTVRWWDTVEFQKQDGANEEKTILYPKSVITTIMLFSVKNDLCLQTSSKSYF